MDELRANTLTTLYLLTFAREHVSKYYLENQSLKIVKQQNKLLPFWVLHLINMKISSQLLHFLIILVWWIILMPEQIKSWRWLSSEALWKTKLGFQLLTRYSATQFLLCFHFNLLYIRHKFMWQVEVLFELIKGLIKDLEGISTDEVYQKLISDCAIFQGPDCLWEIWYFYIFKPCLCLLSFPSSLHTYVYYPVLCFYQ